MYKSIIIFRKVELLVKIDEILDFIYYHYAILDTAYAKYLEDSNRNASREELNEKFENLVESVIIFNLKTIERWKSAFPEYKLENDEENRKFYNQVNKK